MGSLEADGLVSWDESGGSVAPTDSPSVKESGNEDEDYELLEVDGSKFQEMALSEEVVTAMQAVWAKWIEQCGTKEIAGDAFCTMLFDTAPSLQTSFRSPKAVLSMLYMNAFSQVVVLLDQPSLLKREIEVALVFNYNFPLTAEVREWLSQRSTPSPPLEVRAFRSASQDGTAKSCHRL
ncbi:Hypothetical protein SCF082_LOCUS3270 [Durusdinium trenchii]|uniref:Uncharacterized protein n=1 Tax=Durusdinium trenchii TaxID=1381693 RepID=A0ABP0HTB0_9DINO